jgi:hypothetical protein
MLEHMSAAEIHNELCTVYSKNVTSEGTVTVTVKSSKSAGEQMFTRKNEVVGLPL